jgi:cytochrome c oxidase subunit 2
MDRFEKIFFGISVVMLALFLCALFYASAAMHVHVQSSQEVISVKPGGNLAMAVLTTAPFNNPGVKQIGPHDYEVDIIAQAWTFYPSEIKLPAGANVEFKATSVDVTHGFLIPGTLINMMLIPGQVSITHYRFEHAGTYLLLCHEYCGRGHHTMFAKVEVQ